MVEKDMLLAFLLGHLSVAGTEPGPDCSTGSRSQGCDSGFAAFAGNLLHPVVKVNVLNEHVCKF